VGAGLGIGVCPRESARSYGRARDIQSVELNESWARRQLLLGVRSGEDGLPGAAKLFLAHCRQSAARHEAAPLA
jgi:DNA-binding transcriptional LysR family regulator